MTTSDTCPHCNANLVGAPIPESIREHYGNNTNWSRRIALVDRDKDRCVGWLCPDCKRRID